MQLVILLSTKVAGKEIFLEVNFPLICVMSGKIIYLRETNIGDHCFVSQTTLHETAHY